MEAGQVSDNEPNTLVEQLDAAQTGEEFGNALLNFMAAMDKERFADE